MHRLGAAPRKALAVCAILAVFGSGCTAASGNGAGSSAAADANAGGAGKGSIAADFDLQGAHFTVGSKEFTENLILGQITLQALHAAGAKVTDQTGLQGTTIARSALKSGDIDMYWGYAGTGWSLFLKHTNVVANANKQFRQVAQEDLSTNGIRWLGPAHFGDQYAIARRGDADGALGRVHTLSDLVDYVHAHPDEATFCGAAEFLDRKFVDFQHAYGIEFPVTGVYQMALALDYVNVAKGSPCNFAEVFTTDARLKSLDLQVLKDDQHFFLTQLAGLTTRDKLYQKYPELEKLTRTLGKKLTTDVIIKLNAMVDLHGETPAAAAHYFLRSNGFIS